MIDLAIARASIEQDRFARLTQVKKTLHSFEELQNVDRQKVVDLLAADSSFTDSDSSSGQEQDIEEEDDSIEALPIEIESLPEELPSQVLDMTVCYSFCHCVFFYLFIGGPNSDEPCVEGCFAVQVLVPRL